MLFTIEKLPSSSWQNYKEIRLAALKTDPLAFCETYEEALIKTETDWQKHITSMWFALAGEQVVGMVGLLQEESSCGKHRGFMISFWVKPEFRGHGIGKALIQHLQQYAPTIGISKIYFHVTTTQTNAIRLYKSLGFEIVGICKNNTFVQNKFYDQYQMEWLITKN